MANNKILFCVSVCVYLMSKSAYAEEPTADSTANAPIFVFNTDNIAKGEYSFRFTTPDKTTRDETAYVDSEGNVLVSGYYSYIDENGEEYSVGYYADKTGFHIVQQQVDVDKVQFALPPGIVASLLG